MLKTYIKKKITSISIILMRCNNLIFFLFVVITIIMVFGGCFNYYNIIHHKKTKLKNLQTPGKVYAIIYKHPAPCMAIYYGIEG